MRIIIDLQGAQNESRFRGIGRYSLSLTKSLLRNNKDNQIFLLLNAAFPDSIEPIKLFFKDELPAENILTWYGLNNVGYVIKYNQWRREASELLREAFISSLNPDILLISSFFEGAGDNVVGSIRNFNKNIPTAVILYDLIPLLNEDSYLTNQPLKNWYYEKINYFKKADLWLAISNASRQEGIKHLNLPESMVFNISAAADEKFCKSLFNSAPTNQLQEKFNINRPFVMYSGASDPRKNHIRLINAYASLSEDIRSEHQLVIAGIMPQDQIDEFKFQAKSAGLNENELIITGRIDDEIMISLYCNCKCFIFPSWHEGFGLPVLEAMSCGAAVIGSNISSIPEVIGNEDALFDPFNTESIALKLKQVLTDSNFRDCIIRMASQQVINFTWDKTALLALQAMEKLNNSNKISTVAYSKKNELLVDELILAISKLITQPRYKSWVKELSICINLSFKCSNAEKRLMSMERKLIIYQPTTEFVHIFIGKTKRCWKFVLKLIKNYYS